MYEGRYKLDLQIIIFLPSFLLKYVERHRQRRVLRDKYVFLLVNYNLAPKQWQRMEILYIYNDYAGIRPLKLKQEKFVA